MRTESEFLKTLMGSSDHLVTSHPGQHGSEGQGSPSEGWKAACGVSVSSVISSVLCQGFWGCSCQSLSSAQSGFHYMQRLLFWGPSMPLQYIKSTKLFVTMKFWIINWRWLFNSTQLHLHLLSTHHLQRTVLHLKGTCHSYVGRYQARPAPLPHCYSCPHTYLSYLVPTPSQLLDLREICWKSSGGASGSSWLLVCFLPEPSSGDQMLPLSPRCLTTALHSVYHLQDKPLNFPHQEQCHPSSLHTTLAWTVPNTHKKDNFTHQLEEFWSQRHLKHKVKIGIT